MKQAIILLIAALVAVCSCTKNDPHNVKLSSSLVAHFSFRPGTWWVYKDSITGGIDSFAVNLNRLTTYERQGLNYDENDIWITSYNIYGSATFDSLFWSILLEDNSLSLFLPGYQIVYSSLFKYPFAVQSYYGQPGLISLINIHKSYTLNTGNYENVAEIIISKPNNKNDVFYINDDVGIIKISLDIPADTSNHIDSLRRVWELERCKIVK